MIDEKTGGHEQIMKSRGNMDCLVRQTSEEISKIKLEMEKEEKERKLREEERRNRRLKEIQDESFQCSRNMAAIEMKWSEMREIEECEELKKEIEEQGKLFQEVRDGKNNLTNKFQEELKKKEDEYSKMLRRQARDISVTIEKMRGQFFNLRERYLLDLNEVQMEFIKEREDMITSNENALQALFDKHAQLESRFVEQRDISEEQNAAQIEALRIDGAKSYANFKISMETDIQNILKCYEDMKALFQLNTEKLDYNLKILKEKNEESKKIEAEKKKKDNELTEQLRNLNRKYWENDDLSKKENKMLTSKYKQITQQFKELQKKVKHFEKADLDRYNEIQKMNEAEVQKLKEKILKCDISIHVQQLGMPWKGEEWEQEVEEQDQKSKHSQQSDQGPEQEQQQQQQQQQQMGNEQPPAQTMGLTGQPSSQQPQVLELEEQQLVEIVDMIIRETDFLLDDKVRDLISKSTPEEVLLIKMEQIKKALKIDSEDEMNMLFQFLNEKQVEKKIEMKKLREQRFTGEEGGEEGGIEEQVKEEENLDEQEDDGDTVDINNQMINCLEVFMANKDKRKKMLEQMNQNKVVHQESDREKKERIARQGKMYWTKLTQVLPPKTLNVWNTLDKSLTKYYTLLLERQKLIDETGELHNQNEELKNLLNQYLQINHELIIPPTRLIKLEQNQQQPDNIQSN